MFAKKLQVSGKNLQEIQQASTGARTTGAEFAWLWTAVYDKVVGRQPVATVAVQ